MVFVSVIEVLPSFFLRRLRKINSNILSRKAH